MIGRSLFAVAAICFGVISVTAQTKAATPKGVNRTSSSPGLTVEDIMKLSRAGVSQDVIEAKVFQNGKTFNLTPDQILELKHAGVNDEVIRVMMDFNAPPSPQPASVSAPPATESEIAKTFVPEIGLYSLGDHGWNDVPVEVVYWKTGGVMKSLATLGIVKGDINGHLRGSTSSTRLTRPVELLLYTPEGASIGEYQLLRLHRQIDSREFRTVTGGIFHVSGSSMRDLLPLDGKKIGPRTYRISLTDVTPGEYGILPAGSGTMAANGASAIQKIYTLRVIE